MVLAPVSMSVSLTMTFPSTTAAQPAVTASLLAVPCTMVTVPITVATHDTATEGISWAGSFIPRIVQATQMVLDCVQSIHLIAPMVQLGQQEYKDPYL